MSYKIKEIQTSGVPFYIFVLKSSNGKSLLWSRVFLSKETCRDGIVEFYKTCNELSLTNYKIVNSNDKYFISIKSKEGLHLASSQGYKSKRSAQRSINTIKQNLYRFEIEYLEGKK